MLIQVQNNCKFTSFANKHNHFSLVPHIGHLYTTVYADAIFRFSKLVNQPNTNGHIFCTGTDEHGLKVSII